MADLPMYDPRDPSEDGINAYEEQLRKRRMAHQLSDAGYIAHRGTSQNGKPGLSGYALSQQGMKAAGDAFARAQQEALDGTGDDPMRMKAMPKMAAMPGMASMDSLAPFHGMNPDELRMMARRMGFQVDPTTDPNNGGRQ